MDFTIEGKRIAKYCVETEGPARKLNAIKLFRQLTGAGLREAKEEIDQVLTELQTRRRLQGINKSAYNLARAVLDGTDPSKQDARHVAAYFEKRGDQDGGIYWTSE